MANGNELPGQLINLETGIETPFTQEMQDLPTVLATIQAEQAYTEITPINKDQFEVKKYNAAAARLAMDAYFESWPFYTDIADLPDTLTALSVVWSKDHGDGTYSETGSGEATGTSWSLSSSPHGTGQASAIVTPDIVPVIVPANGRNKLLTVYHIFLASPATEAQILARLTAEIGTPVLAWPDFNPLPLYFTLQGGQIDVTATANASYSRASSPDNNSFTSTTGTGTSKRVGSSVTSKQISPTLHAAITISGGTSDSDTGTAIATALTGSGPNFPGSSAVSGPVTAVANGSITPATITATVPPALPSSGLYLYQINPSPAEFGYVSLMCLVFDFSTL